MVMSLWRNAPLWQHLICLFASLPIAQDLQLLRAWGSEIDLWLEVSNRGARVPNPAEADEIRYLWQATSVNLFVRRDALHFTLSVFKVL
jgi:hypothetical protein